MIQIADLYIITYKYIHFQEKPAVIYLRAKSEKLYTLLMFNVDESNTRFHRMQWIACNIPGGELKVRVNDSESKRQDYLSYAKPWFFVDAEFRYRRYGNRTSKD